MQYLVWAVIFIGWNIFVICVYQEVGTFDSVSSSEQSNYSIELISSLIKLRALYSTSTSLESAVCDNFLHINITCICIWQDSMRILSFGASRSYWVRLTESCAENGSCVLRGQDIETIHAGVQILLSVSTYLVPVTICYYMTLCMYFIIQAPSSSSEH